MARPIAKDHYDKRKLILSTAAEVFARGGITSTSMNQVAQACGISKANIYHYYASKNDLVFDILATYLAELRDVICSTDLDGQSPDDRLRNLTQAFLLAYEGMDNEHRIQSEGTSILASEQQAILKTYQRDLVALMSETLQGCAPDNLSDPLKCRQVTMSVFGMLNWFYMWSQQANKAQRIAYATTISDLTLGGIRPRKRG